MIEEMKTCFEGITERNDHLVWLANLPLTHLDEEYLYVHAGIDLSRDMNKQDKDCTFMSLNELYSIDPDDVKKTLGNRTIVHGHTPYSSVYRAGNFISCDTGALFCQTENYLWSTLPIKSTIVTILILLEFFSYPSKRLISKKESNNSGWM